MEKSEMWGYGGVLLLIFGVFAPLITVPIAGTVNYIQNGTGDGVFVLIFAVLSAIFVAGENYKALWGTGGATIALLLFTFFSLQSRISEMRAEMQTELAGNPFRGLGEAMMQSVQMQWGWAMLGIGAVALLVAAKLGTNRTS